MENRYVSTGFLTSEPVCSVSRFSRFVPDLLVEKEEEDRWALELTVTHWRTELFLLFPEIKIQFFSNSSNLNFLCMLHSPNLPAVGWDTAPQYGKFRVPFPVGSLEVFKWPVPSPGIQQPEVHSASDRNEHVGDKVRPARRADEYVVIVAPDVRLRVRTQHSRSLLGFHDLLLEALPFAYPSN